MLSINRAQAYPGFEGWGVNIAWWANTIGTWPEENRSRIMDDIFCPSGLHINIARFNIGAGDSPGHNHMNNEYFMNAQMQGYSDGPNHYQWDRDLAERQILLEAQQRGVSLFEAFCNSAPHWMTVSGCSAGNHNASPNFDEAYTESFAEYISWVLLHFREALGIRFRTVDPFNEPDNTWKYGNAQEGMVVTPETQGKILCALSRKLKEHGLDTQISANDVTNMDHILEQYPRLGEAVQNISQINVHSYGGDQRHEIYDLAKRENKRLWMSEFGCGESESHLEITSALQLSQMIIKDLKELHPAAWIYWQPVENEENRQDSWGLIHARYLDQSYWFERTKQYYVMAQFSRFFRAGCCFMEVSDENVLAARNPGDNTVVLTIQNMTAEAALYEFDFNPFSFEKAVKVFRTSADENCFESGCSFQRGEPFSCSAAPHSVTTYLFSEEKLV